MHARSARWKWGLFTYISATDREQKLKYTGKGRGKLTHISAKSRTDEVCPSYLDKCLHEWWASLDPDRMFLCNNRNGGRQCCVYIEYRFHLIFDPTEDTVPCWIGIAENDCCNCRLQKKENMWHRQLGWVKCFTLSLPVSRHRSRSCWYRIFSTRITSGR